MAWVAEITNKNIGVGYVDFSIRYSDAATTRTKTEIARISDGDLNSLKRYVSNRLSQLTLGDSLESQISLGVFDPTIIETPDPQEQAFQTWMRNYSRLRRVQELISLTILTGTEPEVINLRNWLRNNFQASYINRLN